MREGKIFEADFKASLPDYVTIIRLKDAANFEEKKPTSKRFTSYNVCDYIIFDAEVMYMFMAELKSTKGNKFFVNKKACKDIERLIKYKDKPRVVPVFIINFRKSSKTYMMKATGLDMLMRIKGKKTFSFDEISKISIEIGAKIKISHYKYFWPEKLDLYNDFIGGDYG